VSPAQFHLPRVKTRERGADTMALSRELYVPLSTSTPWS
jgi:hypothetical protein